MQAKERTGKQRTHCIGEASRCRSVAVSKHQASTIQGASITKMPVTSDLIHYCPHMQWFTSLSSLLFYCQSYIFLSWGRLFLGHMRVHIFHHKDHTSTGSKQELEIDHRSCSGKCSVMEEDFPPQIQTSEGRHISEAGEEELTGFWGLKVRHTSLKLCTQNWMQGCASPPLILESPLWEWSYS